MTLNFGSAITYEEGLILSSLARQVARENAVLVEIGSWKGYSASIIAEAIKDLGGHLYCVDHWKGAEGSGLDNEAKGQDIYAVFESNLKTLELWDYITPMPMDSLLASKEFNDECIEFLFIDADHRYEPFTEDLKAWLPKVKSGGIICGHDCEAYYDSGSSELQRRIDSHRDQDFDGNYHCGIVKGLHDFFTDNYSLNPRIWFKEINWKVSE